MKMYVYAFEKLKVWKMAKELVKQIYSASQSFPKEEQFGLTSQVRRAAVSVASNIAEGAARRSSKDQAHFYTLAYSSLMEVLNQLIISFELDFLEEDAYFELRKSIQGLSFKLNALRNSR